VPCSSEGLLQFSGSFRRAQIREYVKDNDDLTEWEILVMKPGFETIKNTVKKRASKPFTPQNQN